jgi:probable phosphoglycerate mutase
MTTSERTTSEMTTSEMTERRAMTEEAQWAPIEVWLVRHGETEWSRTGRHTGRTDIDLTPEGEHVARALRHRLEGEHFALVLSSPRRRALRTAELAGFSDPEVDDDLTEWDYGEYEGRTTPDIRTEVPGWTVWTAESPGGESVGEVAARADRVIARILNGPGRSLVFGHGHHLRVLTARWLRQPPALGASLALHTGTVSVLGWERETPVLQSWNA